MSFLLVFMNLKLEFYDNNAALYQVGGNRQSPRILICKFKFLKSFVDLVLKSTLRALSSGDWTPKSCPSTFISRNSFLPPLSLSSLSPSLLSNNRTNKIKDSHFKTDLVLFSYITIAFRVWKRLP